MTAWCILAFGLAVLVLTLACPVRASSQGLDSASNQEAGSSLRNDSDPTRAVLFSVRPELYGLGSEVTRGSLIFRYDRAALRQRRWLPGRRGVIFRFELPVAQAQVGTIEKIGLGDAYAQLLVAPYFTPAFAFVVGTGLVMPTASDDLLGTGQWILAPAAGPVWFFRGRGMFFVKLQNSVSVGGDSSRPDANLLLVTPTFVHAFAGQWWALADTETKTNWLRDGRTGVRTGVQIGRAVGARVGVWAKPELWWGPNQDGSWNLKFGVVWYRV